MCELRKAAVLLCSLPAEQADALLEKLDPRQVKLVADEITRLRNISSEETATIYQQFADFSTKPTPFGFLREVDVQELLPLLTEEHPQTVALVLSYLPVSHGAKLIASMTHDRQLNVIERLARIVEPPLEIVEEVERAFRDCVTQRRVPVPGALDQSTELAALETLARENPDLVRKFAA